MKLHISTAVKTITAAVLASVFVIVLGAVQVEAAPGGNYFITSTHGGATSFTSWVGASNPQACDAYDAVFYDGQCVKSGGNGGAVLGAKDEKPQASAELIGNRCVVDNGTVEFLFENVDNFELNGPDSDSGGGPDAKTFSGLEDGHYTLSVSNSSNSDSVSFTVDCDPHVPTKPQVSAQCSVSPEKPVVGQSVKWQATATGGNGDYTYQWSGDVNSYQDRTSVTYHKSGEKEGYITVFSDGKKDVARCSIQVSGRNNQEQDDSDEDEEEQNESNEDNDVSDESDEDDEEDQGNNDDNGGNGGGGDKNDKNDGGDNGDEKSNDDTNDEAETWNFSRTIEEF